MNIVFIATTSFNCSLHLVHVCNALNMKAQTSINIRFPDMLNTSCTKHVNWNTHAYFAAPFVCLQAVSRTFNSLYKVLFNFPSRYLFTIGLTVVFSLSRSLPAALGCTLKQPDSSIRLFEVMTVEFWSCYGAFTRYGALLKETCSFPVSTCKITSVSTWHR